MNDFQTLIRTKGAELYRPMPWRDDTRPYYVLVSELMLQQTQVARVIPKFQAFISRFPDVDSLASASLADVLAMWQGLGYNRRAKYLYLAAQMVVQCGHFPETDIDLRALPGVGPNTAGAIVAYSFNQPAIFVETNIRTVYIHHFFADRTDVTDAEIIDKLEQTIDRDQPREFYWALMDYGSSLKAQGVRNIARSKTYKKQSPLSGSVREVRGQIIRVLTAGDMTIGELQERVTTDERFERALQSLVDDGLVVQSDETIHLTK